MRTLATVKRRLRARGYVGIVTHPDVIHACMGTRMSLVSCMYMCIYASIFNWLACSSLINGVDFFLASSTCHGAIEHE